MRAQKYRGILLIYDGPEMSAIRLVGISIVA